MDRDLTHLTRNIRGQILITGDFNGHSYLWGSHDVDTRGEVIERFSNKHNLCILNDGTHTYLKPQAQHVNKPTSAIDLTISTPGLALRSVWEVLPDTHGSDHYPILTSGCGWGCEVSCGGHHRPRGKTTTGSALGGAVFDIAQILAYLVHNMSRSQLYLGFGHFGWLPSIFDQ